MSGDPGADVFATDSDPASIADPFPWPPAADSGWLDALVRTTSAVLTRPTRFFAAMPIDAPLAPAVVFLLILSYAGAGVHLFWAMLLPDPVWIPADLRATDAEAVATFFLTGPFTLAITTVVALLVHAFVVVFGARRVRPRNTVAVFYYASATAILQIVPWLGTLLSGLLSLWITIVGVREVHRASTARAAAAVIAPILLLSMVIVFGVLLLVVAGLSLGVLSR